MKRKSNLVFMTLAALILVATVMFTTVGSAQAATVPTTTAKLKVASPTEIAGVTLQPGDYTVKVTQD